MPSTSSQMIARSDPLHAVGAGEHASHASLNCSGVSSPSTARTSTCDKQMEAREAFQGAFLTECNRGMSPTSAALEVLRSLHTQMVAQDLGKESIEPMRFGN